MIQLTSPTKPNFSIQAQTLRWVERKENGSIKQIHLDCPKVGYTLSLDPYDPNKSYQTTRITKIIESTNKIVQFTTKKEEYKLYLAAYFKDEYFDILNNINK